MSFLGLPTEIRLQIYPQLLVVRKPIKVSERGNKFIRLDGHEHSNGTLNGEEYSTGGLHAAILRVCKQTHSEAVELLYSDNVFWILGDFMTTSAIKIVTRFLNQIGDQASLIRFLAITFPGFSDLDDVLDFDDLVTVETLREDLKIFKKYENITHLELQIGWEDWKKMGGERDRFLDSEELQVLDDCLKEIHSLQEVAVRFEGLGDVDDEQDLLIKEMSDIGWTVDTVGYPAYG